MDMTQLVRVGEIVTVNGVRGRVAEVTPTSLVLKPLFWRRVALHLERLTNRLRGIIS